MQSFKQISEDYDTAIKNLKKVKRGSKVSFNHAKTGKKITGTYQGLKRMMGRSYAHVEHPKGSNHPNMIPVHHIHQASKKIKEELQIQEKKINFGMSGDDHKPGIHAAHKSGLKINHIGMDADHDSGNKPGSAEHDKPDVTVHYERGDRPHRDSPTGVTLHTPAAKKAAHHFQKKVNEVTDPGEGHEYYNSLSSSDQVKSTGSHKMRHDGDTGGQHYAHHHGKQAGITYLSHDMNGNVKANTHSKIHSEVKKQNPHLSSDQHKAVAKDIHNHQKSMADM